MTQNTVQFDSQTAIANMTHEERRRAFQTAVLALVRGACIPAELSSPSPTIGGVDHYKADDPAGRFMFTYETTRAGARIELWVYVNGPGAVETHIHCSSGGYSADEAVDVASVYLALGTLARLIERTNEEWEKISQ